MSKNKSDNQQERLIKTGWVIGFVDGEGCFSMGFVKQPDRQEKTRLRKGYKTGYQVFHEFAVVQGAKSLKSLEMVKDFFGIGNIYLNKRYDNHKEHMYRYVVRKRKHLLEVIVPFFQKNKMMTSKQQDFEKFAKCLKMMEKGEHLKVSGLIKIAKIVKTMNRQKPKETLINFLRDHTPNS